FLFQPFAFCFSKMLELLPDWFREIIVSVLSSLGLYNRNATIVFLGLDNAGKSTLLHRLTAGAVSSLPPTERPHQEVFQFGTTKFKAWDLGGHETVRYLWDDFSADSQGVIFMVDSADFERFEEAKEELQRLLEEPALAE
ncbi:unnamed protein product, partial [Heterosigma akashiwo]